MRAKLTYRSLKHNYEVYAVIRDDGRKGMLKIPYKVSNLAHVGDEGILVLKGDKYKFILDGEYLEFDIVTGLKYPMIVYTGDAT